MPCYQCRAEFSFFKKELSCKACGFSFCSTCLCHEAKVPSSKNSHDKVCLQCYRKLTGTAKPKQEDPDNYIPENFKKRLAEQERRNPRPAPYKRDIPKAAAANSVEARLAALQQERFKNVASVEEIEERLHRLQRQENVTSHASIPSKAHAPAPVSDEEAVRRLLEEKWAEGRLDAGEKPTDGAPADVLLGRGKLEDVDHLMKRAASEAQEEEEMEARHRHENDDIARRLRKLQGVEGATAEPREEEELTEAEQVARLMKQLAEEARIEDAMGGFVPCAAKKEEEEEKELPWCCICNDDAKLRCRGCDDDLFCKRCFREGHKGEDPSEHPTVAF